MYSNCCQGQVVAVATSPNCAPLFIDTGGVHWDDDQLLSLGKHIWQVRQEDGEFIKATDYLNLYVSSWRHIHLEFIEFIFKFNCSASVRQLIHIRRCAILRPEEPHQIDIIHLKLHYVSKRTGSEDECAVDHVLWPHECICPNLRLDPSPPCAGGLWYWGSAAVVSIAHRSFIKKDPAKYRIVQVGI